MRYNLKKNINIGNWEALLLKMILAAKLFVSAKNCSSFTEGTLTLKLMYSGHEKNEIQSKNWKIND